MTATVLPGRTAAVFSAAPRPVVAPQPISASCSKGTSRSIFTTAFSWTSICSAYAERLANCATSSPFWLSRGVWFCVRFSPVREHRTVRPSVHRSQVPQNTDRHVMTRVSGLDVVHQVAHRLDGPGGLVPQDDRHRRGVQPLHEVQVAVADAAGSGTYQDLTWARRRDIYVFNLQGPVYFRNTAAFIAHLSPFLLARIEFNRRD